MPRTFCRAEKQEEVHLCRSIIARAARMKGFIAHLFGFFFWETGLLNPHDMGFPSGSLTRRKIWDTAGF